MSLSTRGDPIDTAFYYRLAVHAWERGGRGCWRAHWEMMMKCDPLDVDKSISVIEPATDDSRLTKFFDFQHGEDGSERRPRFPRGAMRAREYEHDPLPRRTKRGDGGNGARRKRAGISKWVRSGDISASMKEFKERH